MGILRRLFGRKYVPETEATDHQDRSDELDGSSFYTGTATVVIYDLASLKHRLDDEVDWWADPKAELAEINLRNALIVGLVFDGFYDVEMIEGDQGIGSYSLHFPSGQIFIGPGELMTGGGDEPNESCGGIFLNLSAGDYAVSVSRNEDRLRISFTAAAAFENAVVEPIMV